MKEKKCFKCEETKPLSEFYPHKAMGDGHLNKCKECTKRDAKRDYDKKMTNPEWLIKERERQRIKERIKRATVGVKKYDRSKFKKRKEYGVYESAVRRGVIQRQPCQICGSKKSQGHHEDYSKPLEVVWLCVRHHNDRHIHLRNCELLSTPPMHIDEFIETVKKTQHK